MRLIICLVVTKQITKLILWPPNELSSIRWILIKKKFRLNFDDIYSKINIVSPPETFWPNLGLALDEPSDYKLLKIIIEHFEPINSLFSCREVVSFLRAHPELVEINKSVVRKGDTWRAVTACLQLWATMLVAQKF